MSTHHEPLAILDSPAEAAAGGNRFHFALNVADLDRSVAFYRVLFGVEPAKCHPDYAKFEVHEPPVVFSLVPNAPAAGGPLSHLGFRLPDSESVAATRGRLEAAGLGVSCQDGVVCGYARQDKIWVADPDHNYWEFYAVREDVDPDSVRSGFDGIPPLSVRSPGVTEAADRPPSPVVWEHRIMQPPPGAIPHADESLDEVRLEGTFNADLTPAARAALLREAFRVLRPGGRLTAHGLAADWPFPSDRELRLPGIASLVRRVPLAAESLREAASAGFIATQLTKLGAAPAFVPEGVPMREFKLAALKPAVAEGKAAGVVYKGPFAEAEDGYGNIYPRGKRVKVSAAARDSLACGPSASQFLFLNQTAADCLCG